MRVFDVSLEISSNSKNYFGFVVDEFSKREHTMKSRGFDTQKLFEVRLPGTVSNTLNARQSEILIEFLLKSQ